MLFFVKLLTARAAGPIAASIALVLLIATGCQSVRLAGAQSDLAAAEKRVAELGEDLDRCQANRIGLEAKVAGQNAEIQAQARASQDRLSAAEKALTAASKGRASAEARAAALIKNQPQGVDACARFQAADAAVLQSLR